MQDDDVVAFLDARPLFKGHVLVVPRAHVVTLADLPPAVAAALFGAVQRMSRAVPEACGAQGHASSRSTTSCRSRCRTCTSHVVPRTKGDGLKGFFWPRTKYASDAERDDYADKIGIALRALP